jgi:hypothetical protein
MDAKRHPIAADWRRIAAKAETEAMRMAEAQGIPNHINQAAELLRSADVFGFWADRLDELDQTP